MTKYMSVPGCMYMFTCAQRKGGGEVIFRKCLPHLFIYCVCEYPFFFSFCCALTENRGQLMDVSGTVSPPITRVLGIELMLSGLAVGLALGPGADRFG